MKLDRGGVGLVLINKSSKFKNNYVDYNRVGVDWNKVRLGRGGVGLDHHTAKTR